MNKYEGRKSKDWSPKTNSGIKLFSIKIESLECLLVSQ